ncbi:MAG: thioesterase family protein [Pseudomonadota bacterium]
MTLAPLPSDGIVTTEAEVLPEWLDYNDHMNVAYYIAAFDLGIDAFKATIGIDLDYIQREKKSTVALESHITYQQEAALGEKLRIKTRLLNYDGKRCHIYQEMYRVDTLLSTQETLSISFDTALRKSCPFAKDVAPRYQQMFEAQQSLPVPEWVGKSVAIKRKSATAS